MCPEPLLEVLSERGGFLWKMNLGVQGIQFYQASITCYLQGVLSMAWVQDSSAAHAAAVKAKCFILTEDTHTWKQLCDYLLCT